MEEEVWKPVVGYEGLYEVSSLGRVRSFLRRRNKNQDFYILSSSKTKGAYKSVDLYKGNSERKNLAIHRLVALAFIDPVEGKTDVNHIDGVKANNRVQNLEWVTRKENVAHAIRLGLRSSVGESNGRSKLSERVALEILRLYSSSNKKRGIFILLSRQFGVSYSIVKSIAHRKRWKHLEVT